MLGYRTTPEEIEARKQARYAQDIEWAKVGLVRCSRCGGTGYYYWGIVVNGVPSHRGICFKCNGAKTVSNKAGSKRILKANAESIAA